MTWLLVAIVLAVHLLCVNVSSAAPLVCAWFDWREGRGNALAGAAGRYLAAWGLALLVPGGLLGIVLGWLLWDETYRQVLSRFSSKIHFGAWELLFSLALLALHLIWWRKRPTAGAAERGTRIFVALLAGTNLLYHFPTLFAVIEAVASSAEPFGEAITGSEFRRHVARPEVLSRVMHVVLAAVATCGVVLLGYALRLGRAKKDHDDAQRVAAWGGRIALVPTLLQIIVGLWLTGSLSRQDQAAIMQGDVVASLLFFSSIGLSFWMMQILSGLAIGDVDRTRIVRAMVLMMTIILLMSGVLERLRMLRSQRSQRAATTAAAEPLQWRWHDPPLHPWHSPSQEPAHDRGRDRHHQFTLDRRCSAHPREPGLQLL